MKRSTNILLISALLLCLGGLPANTQTQPPAPPHAILLMGTALAPVRLLAESVGATVMWDPDTMTATLTRADATLAVTAYGTTAVSNGRTVTLPAPPLMREQQLFVPVRVVATLFGAAVVVHPGTTQDSAQTVSVAYQGKASIFRLVEAGRMLRADFTGNKQVDLAFAVANVVGIDEYNSPYVSDIVPLEVWVVQGTRELWRSSLATGVSISQFQAQDLTGDRTPDLLLYYLTRHSYMGPYPGSVYHAGAFRWDGRTFQTILSLDYSRDHGHLYLTHPTRTGAAVFILTDTNWRSNEDVSHYIAESYTWNGSRFQLAKRVVTRRPISSLSAAQRLLR